MISYDGKPMVCSGSVISFKPLGFGFMARQFSTQVDQTPVEVKQALADASGLVEFTFHGVALYIDADEEIVAITPAFRKVDEA